MCCTGWGLNTQSLNTALALRQNARATGEWAGKNINRYTASGVGLRIGGGSEKNMMQCFKTSYLLEKTQDYELF